MESCKQRCIGSIVILWGIMVSFIYIFIKKGESMNMMSAEWIALIVAIISVGGAIWAQIIQFKKDAQRIDGVNRISVEVKRDTEQMKPKIDAVQYRTGETNVHVIQRIEPGIDQILDSVQGELKDNIAFLTEDLKFRQRLENEYKGVRTRTMIEGGIKELYDENAVLTVKNHELQKKIEDLEAEKEQYVILNTYLKERIQELEHQIQHKIRREKGHDIER